MDGVIATPAAQEMAEYADAEDEWRQHPAMSVGAVQLHARPDGYHAHSLSARALAMVPLSQRQIGHFMAIARQPLSETPVPALGAADGVGVQAVVHEADSHGRRELGIRSPP